MASVLLLCAVYVRSGQIYRNRQKELDGALFVKYLSNNLRDIPNLVSNKQDVFFLLETACVHSEKLVWDVPNNL